MIEVEIKVAVKNCSLLEEKLVQAGFSRGDLVKETDYYFDSEFNRIRENDMALRIRSCENLTKHVSEHFMTYKGPKMDTVSMTREELEMTIEEAEIGKKILEALGYVPVSPVVKCRQHFCREPITACFDQVEGLGDFLELEIVVCQEHEREAALQEIYLLLCELGYEACDVINTSYLSMLQNKHTIDLNLEETEYDIERY